MATLTGETIVDLAKLTGEDGGILKVAEVLNKQIGVNTVPWKQGNSDVGNMYAVRTAIPLPGTRGVNEGIVASTSGEGQGFDSAIHLEDLSLVDKLLLDRTSDKEGYLFQKSKAKIEGFGQQVMTEMIYGDRKSPTSKLQQRFDGFNTRLNSLSVFGKNCISAEGSSAGTPTKLTSVVMPVWGDEVYGFVPKNMKSGLQKGPTELIEVQETVNSQVKFKPMFRTRYEWNCGLTVENWRQVVRLCNLRYDTLTKNGSSGTDLIEKLITMTNYAQDLSSGSPVFYMAREVMNFLDLQETYKGNAVLKLEEVEGRDFKVKTFRGIPVVMLETMSLNEAAVA